MAANLTIVDGNPIWLSQSVIPSKDTVVSPSMSPTLATINVGSANVFVYVRVDNNGTLDLGVCGCTVAVPAPWNSPVTFAGFLANPNGTTTQSQAGTTFSATPLGDSLTGGGLNKPFGFPGSGRRAWAWSADGRFFAYVASANGNDWGLTIIALQDITRSNGTVVMKGNAAVSGASGVWQGPPFWTNANFAWAGSKAVFATGIPPGGGAFTRSLFCPEAPGMNTWGELVPTFPGQIDWVNLVSPCGSVVAFVPKILQAGAVAPNAFPVSTATALLTQFRQNNVPVGVAITGNNPSISTLQHAAKGVRINTGSGTVDVDDPDCTMVGGVVMVNVDRVKASTLPSANLGVIAVGSAAQGLIRVGEKVWVQVPNLNGWANQSEKHWCLLAQAYTSDLTTIPRAWNGQMMSPPAFPTANQNCAQRNIDILP